MLPGHVDDARQGGPDDRQTDFRPSFLRQNEVDPNKEGMSLQVIGIQGND